MMKTIFSYLLKSGKRISLLNWADDNPEVKNYYEEEPRIAATLQEKYDAWALDVFNLKE